jgi:SAM-dependent methyltransferase
MGERTEERTGAGAAESSEATGERTGERAGELDDPVRGALDRIRAAEGDRFELYGTLAPLYDFVLARRYDHDAVAAFAADRAPPAVEAVAVGGCGPGRLLARLADRYPVAVGLDASHAMLRLAAARTDAPLVAADLRSPVAADSFDLFTLLGNTLAHVGRGSGLAATLESVHASLRPGGVFACDFARAESLVDGHVAEDAFESDRYRVERTVVTAREADERGWVDGRYTYAFTVLDREAGETVRVGTAMPVRAFRPGAVLGAALEAGFAEVTLVDPPTPHEGGLVARRPADE